MQSSMSLFLLLPNKFKHLNIDHCKNIRPDFEAGYRDFKSRLDNYEKVAMSCIVILTRLMRIED